VGLSNSGYGLVAGFCEHDDLSSGVLSGGKFLDQLRDFASQEVILCV
jgi:hypothetical protein